MFHSTNGSGPRRLERTPQGYVDNEVVVTTVKKARNDDQPHYLSVAAGAAAAGDRFDEPSIDGIFQRLGVATASVSRVFVPSNDTGNLAGLSVAAAAGGAAISADYDDGEDNIGFSRTYRVRYDGDADAHAVCRQLASSKAVEKARPNFISEVMRRPDDTFYGVQWGLPAIEAEDAWEIETGHPDLRIAIVDSGVDMDHEDLAGKLEPGSDFVDFQGSGGSRYILLGDYRFRDSNPDDEDGHGSHCAGIAGAISDNNQGVAGVCWGGRIIPVRVMFRVYDRFERRETSVGTDTDIDAGIKYAVDAGAHVMNLSLGGDSPSHEAVLQYAYDRNVCLIAATGNADTSDASYPASNPNCLAVGAINPDQRRADFSNYGPNYNRFVMAPGVKIGSTYKDNGYIYLQGTSMATPFVTGLAGLIVSLALRSGGSLSVESIYETIRETATDIGSSYFYGEGLVNAKAALEAAQEKLSCGGGPSGPSSRGRGRKKQ